MRTRQRDKTGGVKVDRFRIYDIACEDFKISRRMATHACIRRINAEPIRSSELEIDKREVEPDGMTAIGFGFNGNPNSHSPWQDIVFHAAAFSRV